MSKFDSQKDTYWENYFQKDKEFYDGIATHLKESISAGQTGIDIGAGPGIGARLLNNLKIKTKLTGFEPSDTWESNEPNYTPTHGGIRDIPSQEIEFIVILRASHEIAESLGSKQAFFKELERFKTKTIIVAEPQYTDPKVSEELILEIQKYQLKNIGHCHIPSDYMPNTKMMGELTKLGFELQKETIVPNMKLLEYLKEKGFKLNQSPCSFYIQTYVAR